MTEFTDRNRTSDPANTGTKAPHAEAMKEQASVLRDDARELGRLARDAAREEYEALRRQGEEKLHEAKAKAGELEENLRGSVRQEPLKHLAIAAAAGVVLGLFWRR